MKATIVWQKNWDAIHAMAFNEDGSPKLDKDGRHERKYRYIINEGSSRSSKTASLIDCYDLYARENSNKRLTVWRETKTSCKRTVLNDALKHLKKTGRYLWNQYFNKTESVFQYITGSTFEIHGCDDEETVHGLEQDAAWFNEPYQVSKEVFDQIDQRTSDFIFIDWNPKKSHFIEDLKKDSRTLVIHSTFKDNPFCPTEQRRKILGYQPVKRCYLVENRMMTEVDAQQYNCAENEKEFSAKNVQELFRCQENEYKKSANDFNWMVYGLGLKSEKPNRIFHFDEISIHEYNLIRAKTYNGCDWGAVHPWAIIEAKYYDGGLYIRELNYTSENGIRAKMAPTEVQAIKSTDEGIVSWLFNKLGVDKNNIIVCDNNKTTKIQALRKGGWENAVAALKAAGSITDGIDLLNNLRVYYTSDSINLKYEQENYSRQTDRSGIVLDEPEDLDNHLMDCCRYVALFLQHLGIINII